MPRLAMRFDPNCWPNCRSASARLAWARRRPKLPRLPEGTMRKTLPVSAMVLALYFTVCAGASAGASTGAGAVAAVGGPGSSPIDPAAAARFAALALKCLHTEYPSHLSHTMDSDADARPPHELTPAFYGCYDWHSDEIGRA